MSGNSLTLATHKLRRGWTNDNTGCYDEDNNYITDKQTLKIYVKIKNNLS